MTAHLRPLYGLALVLALCLTPQARAASGGPQLFASPERAVDALVAAARKGDRAGLIKIFGAAGRDLVRSGDPVADHEADSRFLTHYAERHAIIRDTRSKATLVLGEEEWPFPIALIRHAGAWHFDAKAGAEEILNRRIGRNELNAIAICRSYVTAQRAFSAQNMGGGPDYARKLVSTAGQHDGLYWPVQPGEAESPIGPQMAAARAEGYRYAEDQAPGVAQPYHGYLYKILDRQGAAAPGGARDYIVDGHMSAGFALIAFPAKYGDSGVVTFIVNQDGLVYEKDLGPETASVAAAIAAFNPDPSWKLARAD